jgi:hypothetical protein
MEKFNEIIINIKKQLDTAKYNGDISDIGNEIGIAIGEHIDKENTVEDFISGLRHGISLVDGTHDKTE